MLRLHFLRKRADSSARSLAAIVAALVATSCGGTAPPPQNSAAPPVVQPGAPGQASRVFDANELESLGGVSYTADDVHFMQGMIPHHAQALEMTDLVRRHSTSEAVRSMALRMEISQRDEIALMERWLSERGESVEMEGMGMGMSMGGMPMMPGMLTPDQMRQLSTAEGVEFDRYFLEFMIQHHEGAIIMVDNLFASSGGQESEIFQFASHVDADQRAEIARMRELLDTLR